MSDPIKSGDLADAITNLGTTLTRVSVAAVTLPAYLLPEASRAEAANAATGFVNAIGAFHLSIAKTALSGASSLVRELGKVADSVQQAAPVVKR